MKKILKKYRGMSNRDVVPMTERHIHSLRILAFANDEIKFTEEEDSHFDACRLCRLKHDRCNQKPDASGRTHYAEGCLNAGSHTLAFGRISALWPTGQGADLA